MQARRLAEILLAIVAIWHLLDVVPLATYVLTAAIWPQPGVSAEMARFSAASVTAHATVGVLAATALLVLRARIAARLAPADASVPSGAGEWQGAALAVLGVYFVLRGVSGSLPSLVGGVLGMGWPGWGEVGYEVTQAVLGAWLFFAAPRLAMRRGHTVADGPARSR